MDRVRSLDNSGLENSSPSGVLPDHAIEALITAGTLSAATPIGAEQIQPASIDLRLDHIAFRVRASFLPGADASVADRLRHLGAQPMDISNGAVLEKGTVHIVKLQESVALPKSMSASANPKSSTGRLDIFTRLITDKGVAFDRVPAGYQGPLYAEIVPRTFPILVRPGSRLNQLRFRGGALAATEVDLQALHAKVKLVHDAPAVIRGNLLGVSLDLSGDAATGLVGFTARKETDVIDIDRAGDYDPSDYWRPLKAKRGQGIVLTPEDFYILATREAVTVPPDHAAEMVAYDTEIGEFRVHYAGFFDPGFGAAEAGGLGSRAVLEVRSHEVPFMLEHEQIVGWLRYEKLSGVPNRLYGQGIGSNYQRQGLKLGKHFKPWR